jgi:aminoglycoside phosphotransferase (APT) family kinase protein
VDREIGEVVGSVLGYAVARVERDAVGGSNQTFFVRLVTGEEIVVRVAPPESANLLAEEIWAMDQCRAQGVPTPEIVHAEPFPEEFCEPYVMMRRLPGTPAHLTSFTSAQHERVLEQLGDYLARIHQIHLPGFGGLVTGEGRYVGRYSTAGDYLLAELGERAGRLPANVLRPAHAAQLAAILEAGRPIVDAAESVLVHGDYHLKNVLVQDDQVTGIVDFENLVAGDRVLDFKDIHLRSGSPDDDLRALQRGYGLPTLFDDRFWTKLYLYEVPRLLEILGWHVRLSNSDDVAASLSRLGQIEIWLREILR